jgi:glucose/arabinose dehydrogenase
MKFHPLSAVLVVLSVSTSFAAELPKPLVTGLKNPESVCLGADRLPYVTEIGEFGKDGDGQVSVIKGDKAEPFAKGLDDPKGIVLWENAFYVTDKTRVVRVDPKGKATTFVGPEKFPTPPQFLNDIALEPEGGALFVSDSGDLKGGGGAVFRIDVRSKKVDLVVDAKNLPGINTPNGLALDGASHLLLLDFGSGVLQRIKLADRTAEKIADGFDGGDGLAWDKFGQLFVTSWKTGKVWGIPRPGQKPILIKEGFEQAADLCVDATGTNLLIPDMKAGTLTALPASILGWEVDTSPLSVSTEIAFPKLEWTGWRPESDSGLVTPLRPILVTNGGDGSNRVFVPTQQGVIHAFRNDDAPAKTTVFLDITPRVRYSDKENEEGFLGLAFHPKFKSNGEFFVFYTDSKAKLTNVVSRFRVSKTDPNKADPASEEVLLRFEKPYWNHDGGTIVFGPDGYLYVTHGDGGNFNDPHENGQNLKTLLGKVLRIDVNRKENGKNYAIPKDNPFAGKKDAAPEIWAYGLRNIWRMAFDRKTGQLWAGDVGQNLYEEIVLVKAGGNYGWNLRESLHPFGVKGADVRSDLIEPIWEYHHDIGKSITGGLVYRGKKVPELSGAYLYADYITARIWALWYDESKGRVVANREIKSPGIPIISFGEDEAGEAYFTIVSANGQGIYRIVK